LDPELRETRVVTVPCAAARRPVLLIHGGLAEDIGADEFWVQPGIVAAIEAGGWTVSAPDRNTTPSSWSDAAAEMAKFVGEASTVVAASNGVSVALRLAIDQPRLVSRLVLLWPATAGDDAADRSVPSSAAHLLVGETVRGVTDTELGRIEVPVAVMASEVSDLFHQRRTVERLVDLIPLAVRLDEELPESPRPDFFGRLDEFMAVLVNHLSQG
jgi:pimeloyl-ACP methyl ester carboxylesterase